MKKIMNFRPIVMLCLSLILGIVLATFVFVSENLKLVFLIICVFIFACLAALSIIFKRKFIAFISAAVFVFMIPIGMVYLKQKEFNCNMKYNNEELVVCGRICENYSFSSGGYLCLTIDDIEFIGANFNDKINGKVRVYISSNNIDLKNLSVGRYISCFGEVKVNSFNDGSKYSLSNLSNNIVATTFVSYSKLNIKDNVSVALDERVRDYVYQKLNNFDVEYADIGYGILFGEDSFIEENVIDSFRTTGIAHILSVSGLHISIIVAVVLFVLSKLKTSNLANLIIMSVILLAYAYLCDFSVSVVRAAVMSLMFLYFKARQKCYDRLSSLALAAFLILMFKPLKLFNVSFIMSFVSVLSIILLVNLFERMFNRCLYLKISKSLAVIVAVQLGLMFIQLYFFKKYSPISILCNLVSIPISTFAFISLIVGMIVSLIFPFMSFVLKIYDFFMGVVVRFNFTFSKSTIVLAVNNLNVFIVFLGLIFILLMSDYLFIKKKYKIVGTSSILLLALILLFA